MPIIRKIDSSLRNLFSRISEKTDSLSGTEKIYAEDGESQVKIAISNVIAKEVGWFDITPFEAGDDGANPATNVLVSGAQPHVYGRRFRGDAVQVTSRFWRFHIPHDIASNPTAFYFHLHWMHNTVSPTGSAIFNVYVNACKRDGAPITEVSTTLTITPLAANCYYQNMVTEIDLTALTGILPNLQVDALFGIYIERLAANDNFGNDIFVRGADLHVQTEGKVTTAKDEGTGWVKVRL